jgi:hypothetical protein
MVIIQNIFVCDILVYNKQWALQGVKLEVAEHTKCARLLCKKRQSLSESGRELSSQEMYGVWAHQQDLFSKFKTLHGI